MKGTYLAELKQSDAASRKTRVHNEPTALPGDVAFLPQPQIGLKAEEEADDVGIDVLSQSPVDRPLADDTTDQLDRLRAHDEWAWRDLFTTYGPRLLAYATKMLRDPTAAEEVVQDALLRVFKSIDRFRGECSLKAWLFRAVHNRAIDELRAKKRFVNAPLEDLEKDFFDAAGAWNGPVLGEDLERHVDARKLLARVEAAILTLPHAYREVLLLKEVQGLQTAELCGALQLSAGNVRIRLLRARKALRAAVFQLEH